MINMNEAPIGELIDLSLQSSGEPCWFTAIIKYVGKRNIIYEDKTGFEWSGSVDLLTWRYPVNPKDELQKRILSDWRSQGLDYSHDTWSDITKDWILQWILDNGVSVE